MFPSTGARPNSLDVRMFQGHVHKDTATIRYTFHNGWKDTFEESLWEGEWRWVVVGGGEGGRGATVYPYFKFR